MEDLREKTHTQHYELYRQKRLQEMGFADMSADNRPVRLVHGLCKLAGELEGVNEPPAGANEPPASQCFHE